MNIIFQLFAIAIMFCSMANLIRLIKKDDVHGVVSGWTLAGYIVVLSAYLVLRFTLWNIMDFQNWKMSVPFFVIHSIGVFLIGRSLWTDKVQMGVSFLLYVVGVILFEVLNTVGSFW